MLYLQSNKLFKKEDLTQREELLKITNQIIIIAKRKLHNYQTIRTIIHTNLIKIIIKNNNNYNENTEKYYFFNLFF